MRVTERGRQTYALLRTLLAWVPPPTTRSGIGETPRGFAHGSNRYVSCPDCLANDRPKGMVGCETCGGHGEIRVPGPDPYEIRKVKPYGFHDHDRRRDLDRRRDTLIARLEQDERVRAGIEANLDEFAAAVEGAEKAERAGSYGELWRALERLRLQSEPAYHVALSVAYAPFDEEPVEPVRRFVCAVCEVLARWMPDPIRVPASVPVWTREEAEQRAALMRERATWRGRRDPLARARRDDTIRRLAAEGMDAVTVAERVGVHRRTVERVLASREAA